MTVKRRSFIFYILLAVVFATLIRCSFFYLVNKLDFADNKILKLNGQWQIYSHIFIDKDEEHDCSYINVPGNWRNELDDFQREDFTYGSYKLNIYLDKNQGSFALKVDNIATAYRSFINGELITEMGMPSLHRSYIRH